MARFFQDGHEIAVRAGSRIGSAARADDDGVRVQHVGRAQLFPALGSGTVVLPFLASVVFDVAIAHAGHTAVLQDQADRLGVRHDAPAGLRQDGEERVQDIARAAAGRKDPAAPFLYEWQAVAFEQVHHVFVREAAQGTVQELAVAGQVADELGNGAGIGDVAAALPRNHHFAARDVHLFQDDGPGPVPRRRDAGQKARRTAADDDDPVALTHGGHRLS